MELTRMTIETQFNVLAQKKSYEKKIPFEHDRPIKTIEELFEGYDGDYKLEEIDWGEPVGDEVW